MTNTKTQNTTYNNLITKTIINWPEYNKALIKRGDMQLLLEEALVENIFIKPKPRSIGRPKQYSDELILTS